MALTKDKEEINQQTHLYSRKHEISSNGECNDERSPTKSDDDGQQRCLHDYFIALRPWSFSASLTPVLLGTVLSWKETGHYDMVSAVLVAISIMSVHGAGNLVNTYYDFLRGIDDKDADDQTLVSKMLKPNEVVSFGVAIYVIGCVCFLTILAMSPSRVDHLALMFFVGLSGSFLYTGSIGLKYYALGDIIIILTFGPVSVLFAYMAQCGHMSTYPLICAIPLVMNTEAILHGNNTRDIKSDFKSGVLTLAIILGFKMSYVLFFILIFVPYLIVFCLVMKFSFWFVIPLVTIPIALRIEKDFRFGNLTYIPQKTAKLNLVFGLLYVIAFVLS